MQPNSIDTEYHYQQEPTQIDRPVQYPLPKNPDFRRKKRENHAIAMNSQQQTTAQEMPLRRRALRSGSYARQLAATVTEGRLVAANLAIPIATGYLQEVHGMTSTHHTREVSAT